MKTRLVSFQEIVIGIVVKIMKSCLNLEFFSTQALVVLVHDMGPNWELVSDAINSTLQFKVMMCAVCFLCLGVFRDIPSKFCTLIFFYF